MENEYFKCGFFSHDVLNLSAKDAFDLCMKDAMIIDVRETSMTSYKMFGIERSVNMPYSTLKSDYTQIPSEIPIIFADSAGLHSREAVLFMMEKGYRNIANLCGGLIEWEKDGFPVITDSKYMLTGSCMCQLKIRDKKHNKQM